MNLTQDEMRELVHKRNQGDEQAHKMLFQIAWDLMNFFARRYNAMEHTYTFYEKLQTILDSFDPDKGNLSSWINLPFKWHIRVKRERKVQCVASTDADPGLLCNLAVDPDIDDEWRDNVIKCAREAIGRLKKRERDMFLDRFERCMKLEAMRVKYKLRSHQTVHYYLTKIKAEFLRLFEEVYHA